MQKFVMPNSVFSHSFFCFFSDFEAGANELTI